MTARWPHKPVDIHAVNIGLAVPCREIPDAGINSTQRLSCFWTKLQYLQRRKERLGPAPFLRFSVVEGGTSDTE